MAEDSSIVFLKSDSYTVDNLDDMDLQVYYETILIYF